MLFSFIFFWNFLNDFRISNEKQLLDQNECNTDENENDEVKKKYTRAEIMLFCFFILFCASAVLLLMHFIVHKTIPIDMGTNESSI